MTPWTNKKGCGLESCVAVLEYQIDKGEITIVGFHITRYTLGSSGKKES